MLIWKQEHQQSLSWATTTELMKKLKSRIWRKYFRLHVSVPPPQCFLLLSFWQTEPSDLQESVAVVCELTHSHLLSHNWCLIHIWFVPELFPAHFLQLVQHVSSTMFVLFVGTCEIPTLQCVYKHIITHILLYHQYPDITKSYDIVSLHRGRYDRYRPSPLWSDHCELRNFLVLVCLSSFNIKTRLFTVWMFVHKSKWTQ